MKKVTEISEIKQLELDILKAFAKFCDEHNLKYFLVAGTLLGAVRHKGFIPWDDDIDVSMPRPDYQRLLEIAGDKLTDRYSVWSMKNRDNHSRLFMRIVDDFTITKNKYYCDKYQTGLWIDVFPLDAVPNIEKEKQAYFKKISFWREVFTLSHTKLFTGTTKIKALKKTICAVPSRLIGRKRIYRIVEKKLEKYNFDNSENIAISVGVYHEKEIVNKRDYLNSIKIEFEGDFYNAPGNYHEYLTSLYGDYMKLPPENMRKRNHTFDVWMKK